MDDSSAHNSEELLLEHLLSIWPVVSSLASHASAGDVISLSRTSHTIRALTHGFASEDTGIEFSDRDSGTVPDLRLGNHQTSHWAGLKSLAQFTCCSPFHKDPKSSSGSNNTVRPCKFCSRPVCKACIVRSFFSDPSHSKNTFRYRTRYLCTKCWETGNLRKDFRYPAETTSREHVWQGQNYGQRGSRCSCSASEDNWLCRDCRTLQNISGPTNSTLFDAQRGSFEMIQRNRQPKELSDYPEDTYCYGLGCTNMIDQYTKDRRRICLWCSKSLPRQFGGEDRLRWEEKQVEIRAAAAASRSADIQEWARNRFRSLTMSRREMRGTEACILLTGKNGPEHDQPIFVRHLDAINYRKYLPESAAPNPGSVYLSKHGRWTYSPEFLLRIDSHNAGQRLPPPSGHDPENLHEITRQGGMKLARPNRALRNIPRYSRGFKDYGRGTLVRLAAQFHEAGLMTEKEVENIFDYSWSNAWRLEKLSNEMCEQLEFWEECSVDESAIREPITFGDLLITSQAKLKNSKGKFVPVNEPVADSGSDVERGEDAGTRDSNVDSSREDQEEASDEEVALQDQSLAPANAQSIGPVNGHYVFSPDGIDVEPIQRHDS